MSAPDTIVLIHGFWVTPRSWEHWIAHYEAKGYKVLAPAYPGFEVEVEALNADHTAIEALTVQGIVDHLESVVGAVATPPILMGHSAGGVFTQLLLDKGYGAAGVAINSAPTEGVKVLPLSQARAAWPVLKNPANRHRAVGLNLEQWQYAFTNTFTEEEWRALYERYHVPASGSIFWESAFASFKPGHQEHARELRQRRPGAAAVHLRRRGPPDAAERAALQRQALLVGHDHRGQGVRGLRAPAAGAGGLAGDRRLRARVGRRARRRKCRERPGRPVDRAAGGGERLDDVRFTHVGGPTVLIEVGGWRLLTDPTFDAPGQRYGFGWGSWSRKLAGPAIAADDLLPLDAVLLTHDHHDDNLDPAGRALLPSAGTVVTTEPGARRLGMSARGLRPWATTRLEAPGKPAIEITATPCRHGPPLSHPIVGDVVGFSLRWEGQEHGELWISGDTVLYDGVREVAQRLRVDTALLHLGGVQFGVTGPLRYTMTGKDAVELMRAGAPARRDPDPLRGLAALPRRARGDRARARDARRPTCGPACGGCRSAWRRRSRSEGRPCGGRRGGGSMTPWRAGWA